MAQSRTTMSDHSSDNGDELWLAALKDRTQFYRLQIHTGFNHQLLQDRIGKTLAALNDVAVELKFCMNTASASHLPPEILSLIFHSLSRDLPIVPATVEDVKYHKTLSEEEEDDESPESSGGPENPANTEDAGPCSTWVKVTQVSHFWREVALRDASLWTEISTERPWTWTDSFLTRSRPKLNLTVHLGSYALPSTHPDNPVWKEAISRARTLYMTDSFEHWQWCLPRNCPASLVKVSVSLISIADDYDYDSPRFFGKNYSHNGLRELSLCGFRNYSWPPPLLCPTLTSLKLGVLADIWTCINATVDIVLDTLAQLQRLQSLTLLGFDTAQYHNRLESYRDTVRLPCLRLLHIEECSPETSLAIVNAVVISVDDAKICLAPAGDRWEASDTEELQRILGHRLSMPPWSSIQTVALLPTKNSCDFLQSQEQDSSECIFFSAWRTDVGALFYTGEMQRLQPDIYLRLFWSRYEDDLPYKLLHLFDHSPIRTLCLLTDQFGESFRWVELHHFAALQHLMLHGPLGMAATQCMYNHHRAVLPSHPFSSPSGLKRLTLLKGASWVKETAFRNFQDGSLSLYTHAQLLECVFQERADSGSALEVFVDKDDLESGAFGSMSDQSMLQAIVS